MSSNSGLSAAVAPERGVWPGLGSANFADDLVQDQETDFRNERDLELDHAPDGPQDGDTDEVTVLLDRIERFDRLALERRAAEAYAIAGGWSRCKQYYPVDDAALLETARRRYENSMRYAEAELAGAGDTADVESDIRRIAEIDPETVIVSIFEALKDLERECAGIESFGFDERSERVLRWVARAAELGHRVARADYVYMAFFGWRISPGHASVLVERKRRVARYVLEMLTDRDVRGLELAGFVTSRGYFQAPDPEIAYGYTKAALEITKGGRSTKWRVLAGDDRKLAVLDGRLAEIEKQLDSVALVRAESLARRIVDVSN